MYIFISDISILLFSHFSEGNISKESLDSLGKDVERIIIRGPRQYIEQPNEWMHEFKWHGSSEKSDYDSGKTKKVFSLIPIHYTKQFKIALNSSKI